METIKKHSRLIMQGLWNLCYPSSCASCHEELAEGFLSICRVCKSFLDTAFQLGPVFQEQKHSINVCRRCGFPIHKALEANLIALPGTETLNEAPRHNKNHNKETLYQMGQAEFGGLDQCCYHCFDREIYYDAYNCPFVHSGQLSLLRRGIYDYKFNKQGYILPYIHIMLAEYQRYHIDLSKFDLLLPVPVSKAKISKGGIDQVRGLFRPWLAGSHRKTAPALGVGIVRHHDQHISHKSQGRSNRFGRVAGAFSINLAKRHLLDGKRVLLLDDIATTGSTINFIAYLLKKHGAKFVQVVALMQTGINRNKQDNLKMQEKLPIETGQ